MRHADGYNDLLMKQSQCFKSDWDTLGNPVEHAKLTSAVAAACTHPGKEVQRGQVCEREAAARAQLPEVLEEDGRVPPQRLDGPHQR